MYNKLNYKIVLNLLLKLMFYCSYTIKGILPYEWAESYIIHLTFEIYLKV